MTGTLAAVLRAATQTGVTVDRYTQTASDTATGRALSTAAVRRAVRSGQIERVKVTSLNFHYQATASGLAALRDQQPHSMNPGELGDEQKEKPISGAALARVPA